MRSEKIALIAEKLKKDLLDGVDNKLHDDIMSEYIDYLNENYYFKEGIEKIDPDKEARLLKSGDEHIFSVSPEERIQFFERRKFNRQIDGFINELRGLLCKPDGNYENARITEIKNTVHSIWDALESHNEIMRKYLRHKIEIIQDACNALSERGDNEITQRALQKIDAMNKAEGKHPQEYIGN